MSTSLNNFLTASSEVVIPYGLVRYMPMLGADTDYTANSTPTTNNVTYETTGSYAGSNSFAEFDWVRAYSRIQNEMQLHLPFMNVFLLS